MNHRKERDGKDIALQKLGSSRERGWHFPCSARGIRERLRTRVQIYQYPQAWASPHPALAERPEGTRTDGDFASQPHVKASLAQTPALFSCKSQQHFVGKLCTQACSVRSGMVVYLLVFSKSLCWLPGEQGQAQGNCRLCLPWLVGSTDPLTTCVSAIQRQRFSSSVCVCCPHTSYRKWLLFL